MVFGEQRLLVVPHKNGGQVFAIDRISLTTAFLALFF